ncbi:serine hydrolase domain-containing protein [Streptomyces sp. NPDC059786]|uniref:serine hydrolase domain-containing protein n=1 Tax=Streptomyces sp. NPDC059786 TaxID=3346946 RepID=UPI00365A2442
MSARPLPVSTPAAQGVDASGVHAFLDAVEAAPDIEPHSLMILRHGRLVASGWWAPYTEGRAHLLYSLSKSFTSTAAGFAVAEGLLDLDAPVLSYFPEFADDIVDPRSRAMLVRHVAAMASGHLAETFDTAIRNDRERPVRGFLLIPPDRDPGTVFAYNQPATYSLAAIVQRRSGQTLTDYLRPRLFDPLGIGEVAWHQHPRGSDLGFSGLHATTDAVARLGQLYLRKGVWEGRQLLSPEWVAEATRPHIATSDGPVAAWGPDARRGYGFQFWMSRHGYRGDGAYGQLCLVLPEQDAVIALTSATGQSQELLNLVWRHLLPAFTAAPLGGEGDDGLRRRLAELALPPLTAPAGPPADAAAWRGARFTPAADPGPDAPRRLAEVGLAAGAEGWTLTLHEKDTRFDLPFGPSGWTTAEGTVPMAVTAGWTDAGTLRADIVFLETPHRLSVTCSLAAGTFTARWHTTPLRGSTLGSLYAPFPGRVPSSV